MKTLHNNYCNSKQGYLPLFLSDYLDLLDPVLTFDGLMGEIDIFVFLLSQSLIKSCSTILHNRSLYCRLWGCLLWRDFFFCFSIAYLHYNRKQFISKFAISHVSCRYIIFSTIKEFIYDI